MTLEEARTQLAIGADAAPEQVRRAYLRLLKQHKPETDPAGFMRLREAFELLDGVVQALCASPPTSASDSVPACGEGAAPVPPATAEDRIESYRRALGRLSPSDYDGAARLAREATRELPDEREPRLWLTFALESLGREAEAAAVLREGYLRGDTTWLEELARGFPSHLLAEDLVAFKERLGSDALWALARELLDAGALAAAAHAICAALDPCRPLALERRVLVEVVLGLHRSGQPDLARDLATRLEAWFTPTALSRELSSQWAAAQALCALSPSFPLPVRAAVAEAICTGDPLRFLIRATELVRADPDAAQRAAAQLRQSGGALLQFAHLLLQQADDSPRQESARVSREPATETRAPAADPEAILAGFRAALERLPPGALHSAVRIAREALARLPESEEARRWLVGSLEVSGQAAEAAEVLRQGHRLGQAWCLEELACRFPAFLQIDDARALRDGYSSEALWVMIGVLMRTDDLGGAARLAAVALEGEPTGEIPNLPLFISLVLLLHAAESLEHARLLTFHGTRWAEKGGVPAELLERWKQVEAFACLGEDFPASVRRMLADSLGRCDERVAARGAKALARRDRAMVVTAAALLHEKAPALGRYADLLDAHAPRLGRRRRKKKVRRAPGSDPAPRRSKRASALVGAAILAAVAVLAALVVAAVFGGVAPAAHPLSMSPIGPLDPSSPNAQAPGTTGQIGGSQHGVETAAPGSEGGRRP